MREVILFYILKKTSFIYVLVYIYVILVVLSASLSKFVFCY